MQNRDEMENISVGSSNRGRAFCYPSVQLGSHGDCGEVVTTDQFGVSEDKGRTQRKGDQRDQHDSRQPTIGDRFTLARGIGSFRPVPASVQKSMFESPMFGEVHPPVVLIRPAIVSQVVNHRRWKRLLR